MRCLPPARVGLLTLTAVLLVAAHARPADGPAPTGLFPRPPSPSATTPQPTSPPPSSASTSQPSQPDSQPVQTGRFQFTFTEKSPQSVTADICKRMGWRVEPLKEFGKPMDYDPAKESYEVYVPESYTGA